MQPVLTKTTGAIIYIYPGAECINELCSVKIYIHIIEEQLELISIKMIKDFFLLYVFCLSTIDKNIDQNKRNNNNKTNNKQQDTVLLPLKFNVYITDISLNVEFFRNMI